MSDITNLNERALPKLSALELESIRPLQECARLQSTSVDTIIREDAKRVARGEKSRIVRPKPLLSSSTPGKRREREKELRSVADNK